MSTIPSYAVDLLMAARAVAYPSTGATPDMLDQSLYTLGVAVQEFERSMPVVDGVIQEVRLK